MGLEEMDKCIDPQYQRDWMPDKASTYYPKGTICFKDPSSGKHILYMDRDNR